MVFVVSFEHFITFRRTVGRNQAIGVCRRLSSIVAAYQELSKGTKTQELSDAGIGLSEQPTYVSQS